MKGGKLIGEGTYGCAFYPHLPCEGNHTYPGSVGKIFSNDASLIEEEDLSRFTQSIDPTSAFTIPLKGKCVVKKNSITKQDKQSKCSKFTQSIRIPQKQLLYDYGGIDLQKFSRSYAVTNVNFYIDDLIPILLPVFDGISKLVAKGWTHTDIKPANMVYEPNKNQIYLIDFGMMSSIHTIHQLKHVLVHPYIYYPPEFLVMNAFKKNQQVSSLLHNDFMRRFSAKFISFLNKYRYFSVNTEIKTFMKKVSTMNKDSFGNKFNNSYVHKLDSYSLGMSLLEIVYNLEAHDALRIRDINVFEMFVKLLARMTHMNPELRLDPVMAYTKLELIVDKSPISKPCIELSGKEIKQRLEKANLPKYGTKKVMCERLEKHEQEKSTKSKPCIELSGKEIKQRLENANLPKYGTKKVMCERLEKHQKTVLQLNSHHESLL